MTKKDLIKTATLLKVAGVKQSDTEKEIVRVARKENISFACASPQHLVNWVYTR
tara:strand:+ start:52 stop:213 length:162 start_codon:yes stop_codon:yes gene_type:complete